ncbi:hypothetical protein [Maribacter sp. 2308TA10-17]|uniref:hypothetical protein n=1 Tax=Maribacter sp. 2308TA10-17 TaxID=3386276 RepID=UPI0039BD5988
MIKRLFFYLILTLSLSCGKDTVEPETESEVDEIIIEEEQEDGEEEELPEEEPIGDMFEIPFDVSILVRDVNSDDKFLIDYTKGEEAQSIDNILNLGDAFGSRAPIFYDNRANILFFWERTPQRNVYSINVKSKEIEKFINVDGVSDETLFAYDYLLHPFPTVSHIVTLDSHRPLDLEVGTLSNNSLRIYNQQTGELELMSLPDEDRISGGFGRFRSNGEFYIYQNSIEKDNGSLVDEWKVVDLTKKEIIAQFDLFNDDRNFAWNQEKVYFSDGRTFDVLNNAFSEDYAFSFDLGTPNMVDAQLQDDQIFFKATSVVKDNMVDRGIVLYNFQTKESKKILERELLDVTLAYFGDQQTRYQEILQAYYDFDTGIIALTSSNNYPNYAVIFLDFELNILKVNKFSGYEPLKIAPVE